MAGSSNGVADPLGELRQAVRGGMGGECEWWCGLTDRDCGHLGWIMLAVRGHRDAPEVVVCTSPDGVHWSLLGPLELVGDTGVQGGSVVGPPRLPPGARPTAFR